MMIFNLLRNIGYKSKLYSRLFSSNSQDKFILNLNAKQFSQSNWYIVHLTDISIDSINHAISVISNETNYKLHSMQISVLFEAHGLLPMTPFINVVGLPMINGINVLYAHYVMTMHTYNAMRPRNFYLLLVFKNVDDSQHQVAKRIQQYQLNATQPRKVTLPTRINLYERHDILPVSFNYINWSIPKVIIDGYEYFCLEVNNMKFYIESSKISDTQNQHFIYVLNPDGFHHLTTVLDTFINHEQFIRSIKPSEFSKGTICNYTYLNGEVIRFDKVLKTKLIDTVRIDRDIQCNFVTMDFECYLSGTDTLGLQKFVPYAIGIYDEFPKPNFKSFYLTDYDSPTDMIIKAFAYLSTRQFKNQAIYIHNLNNFDLPFFLSILNTLGKVVIIDRNNTFIEIKFYPKSNPGMFISIRDSILLLPGSLADLSKTFKVEVPKSAFPHSFVTKDTLNYVGVRPDKSYWPINDSPIGPEMNWDLKNELINYLKCDVVALWQVIQKYQRDIYINHDVNILTTLTLPALAFKIYRSGFYDKMKYPISAIHGKIDLFIRQSYYGGLVDVFEPYGEKLYKYDINSSYPFSMKKDMPIGLPTFIDGNNLSLDDTNLFGFFYCLVESPQNNTNFTPILPIRDDNGNVICPEGTWKGVYFSEELRAAIKVGYKVKLYYGYNFERGRPFDAYIDHWYKIKSESHKSSLFYFMAKLFLNSLYGRFGMNPRLGKTQIIHINEFDKFLDTKLIQRSRLIGDDYMLINTLDLSQLDDMNEDITDLINDINYIGDKVTREPNVNVAIASAITAYARIHINTFKNIEGNKCFYSDTDSVVMQFPLPDEYVGPELGKMKLERVINRGVYLGPKTYGEEYIKTQSQTEIEIEGFGIETIINYEYDYDFKIKGLSEIKPTQMLKRGANKPTLNDMINLLNKDSVMQLEHQLWIKDLKESTILVKDRLYELKMTFTKRIPIFKDGKVISTKAYTINKVMPHINENKKLR